MTAQSAPPTYIWPKIAHDPGNSGVSADPATTSANAGGLGVWWMASSGASILGSPVVAFNAALGQTLVYQGNEAGYLTAYSAATGAVVWSTNLGSAIRDTPLVDAEGNVWVSPTFNPALYKISGATGVPACSAPLVSTDNATATIGAGQGGAETVYIGVNDLGTQSGPVYAVKDADCSVEWQFTNFDSVAGTWDPYSYGVDSTGRALLLLGTADPDASVYAIDAVTGAKVWSFKTLPKPGSTDIDVGGGVTVSPPGTNGFADGVAYVGGKDGYEYALDLTTGALIWDFNFFAASGTAETKSTAALVGNTLVFGETTGAYALNATTGAVIWRWNDGGGEVLSTPAVVGPPGSQVVAVATLAGSIDVLSLATGQVLYAYHTGGFSTSSVADVDGNLLASSSDGFLYDLSVGGGNGASPTTTVTGPVNGSTIAYPTGGSQQITGSASGAPIASVNVAIQSGGSSGPWWDGATRTWSSGYFDNPVSVASPGSSDTTWSLGIPVPTSGGVYRVQASAVGTNGVADITADSAALQPSQSDFSVSYSTSAPHLYSSKGKWVAPASVATVGGSGFGAGENVQLSLNGTVLATATATSTGVVPKTNITIPTGGVFGQASLVATGQTSGKATSTPLEISNVWSEAGYNSLHTGTEPNDAVMAHHVSPTQAQYFAQAWSYPTGAAIRTQPAISKDIAYFGNDAATFTALNVQNSQPVWTATEPSPISSSAALDNGMVFFGTTGGSVVALGAATGISAWVAPTTSSVTSSPAVAAGAVYVGSDDGTLYSLNEKTGVVNWKTILGGAITASPAVDTAAAVVIVGDASGNVTALSATTGAVVWSFQTGAPVSATVTINAGRVLVPSQNGKVFALNETTGAVVWSHSTGVTITSGGALYYTQLATSPSQYAVGGADGNLYYLALGTGNLAKTVAIGGPIVGVSGAQGWIDATTSNGMVAGDKPGNVAWKYTATAGYDSTPTPLNGVVYVTGLDQTIRAFTIPGQPIP